MKLVIAILVFLFLPYTAGLVSPILGNIVLAVYLIAVLVGFLFLVYEMCLRSD